MTRSSIFSVGLVLLVSVWSSVGSSSAEAADPYAMAREILVRERVATAGVTDSRVLDSIRQTPRHEFVPLEQVPRAYFDMALPIGHSQTISSPFIVASMTESLDPQPRDIVLEIGTGSGYQAAVLSPLVDQVYTIEIVKELGEQAAKDLRRLDYDNVHTRIGDGFLGWPEVAPFDKIIVTCSPESVPLPLIEQLREGGQMVIPVGQRYQQTMYRMIKRDGKLVRQPLQPTLFVPMTGTAEDSRQELPDATNPRVVNGNFNQPPPSSIPRRPESQGSSSLPGESLPIGSPDSSPPAAGDDGASELTPDASQEDYIAGWYYGRQVRWINADSGNGSSSRSGGHVRFYNETPGLASHLLQGIAIDGSLISTIRLSAKCRTENVRMGPTPDAVPMLALSFYDEDRADLGMVTIGPFRGTRPWKTASRLVRVPTNTREAIVRIGLFGATGTAEFDDVEIEKIGHRSGR